MDEKPSLLDAFTFSGVARFGLRSTAALLKAQLLAGLLAGAASAWFVWQNFFPIVHDAISRLPETAEIAKGRLTWPEGAEPVFAGNQFLAIVLASRPGAQTGQGAHLQLELGQTEWRARSFLGYISFSYPSGWITSLSPSQLKPWWGAWQPALLAAIVAGVALLLLATWAVLAACYWPLVSLLVFLLDRQLSRAGKWRLAGAALIPGSFWNIGLLIFFGLGQLGLAPFLAGWMAHFLIGIVYLLFAPIYLPRRPGTSSGENPFADAAEEALLEEQE